MNRQVSGVEVGIGHSGTARYGSAQKSDTSDIMQGIYTSNGVPENHCPFGCEIDDLDENGYCYHLIGFSPDGKKLERNEVGPDGRRRTKARLEKVNGRERLVFERVDPSKHCLARVTTSYRVYENVRRPDSDPEPDNDELEQEESQDEE